MKLTPLATLLLIPLAFGADDWKLPTGNEPALRPAANVGPVVANCMICHSADYISTQPPLNRASWTAIVVKMREKYGAPLPTNQVEQVVEYLVTAYGKK